MRDDVWPTNIARTISLDSTGMRRFSPQDVFRKSSNRDVSEKALEKAVCLVCKKPVLSMKQQTIEKSNKFSFFTSPNKEEHQFSNITNLCTTCKHRHKKKNSAHIRENSATIPLSTWRRHQMSNFMIKLQIGYKEG